MIVIELITQYADTWTFNTEMSLNKVITKQNLFITEIVKYRDAEPFYSVSQKIERTSYELEIIAFS